LLIKLK